MDSIKYNVKGHNVVFSKRDLTIDGEVYKYTGISQVKHSSAYKAYLFRYNGEWVKLFYDEQHASAVAALFKRINAMNAKRLAKARATQSIDTAAIAAALAAAEKEEEPEEKPVEKPEAKAEEPAAKPAEEPKPEPVPVPIPPVEPVLELEPTPEPKAEEKPEAGAEVVEEEKPEAPEEKPAEEPKAELTEEEKVKKAKKKKAFIIFAIIIALFLVAGIIYFLTVGTTNDASQGPNVDETHQYNDIEELIEEMQE